MQTSDLNPNSPDVSKLQGQSENDATESQSPILTQPVKQLTCIERATNFIDGVTDSLYYQILEGFLHMNKRKSLPGQPEPPEPPKKRSMIIQKPIDTDEHRRMMRRFKRQNRKLIKTIEERSIQYEKEAKKAIDEEERQRNQERNRTIEQRKLQISEKLRKKEELMEQIRKEVSESNRKFQSLKKVKFLYQEKEEAFKKEFILPKIQEEKRILMKKKEEMRPMDMTLILQHQKQYQEKRVNDRINRSLTSRVLQSENHYEPPKFVPKSFMILEAEEEIKKDESKLKAQEAEINEFRKKEFLKMMEEKQKHSIQKIKQTLEKSRSKGSLGDERGGKLKEKQKMSLDREEAKKIGNQYMKQLVKLNFRAKTKRNASESSSELNSQLSKQRPKSQYEIELIKEERIEKVQKFRMRKIDEIVNNEHFDRHFKLERLKHEDERIDQLVSAQQPNPTTHFQADEMAALYLSSIHTKLAILQVASPRKAQLAGG